MTRNQRLVVSLAQNGIVTTDMVAAKLSGRYFLNSGKYISELLSRMVKQGFLVRKSPGVFQVTNFNPDKRRTGAAGNAPDLFTKTVFQNDSRAQKENP